MGRGETIVTVLKPKLKEKRSKETLDFIQVHIYLFTDLSSFQKYVGKA